jgi:hypothetical protein
MKNGLLRPALLRLVLVGFAPLVACSNTSNPPPTATLTISGSIVNYTENTELQIVSAGTNSIGVLGTINPNGSFDMTLKTPSAMDLFEASQFNSTPCTVISNQNQPSDFKFGYFSLQTNKNSQPYGVLVNDSSADRVIRVSGQYVEFLYINKAVQINITSKCTRQFGNQTYMVEYRQKHATTPGWNIALVTYKSIDTTSKMITADVSRVESIPPNIKWFFYKNSPTTSSLPSLGSGH